MDGSESLGAPNPAHTQLPPADWRDHAPWRMLPAAVRHAARPSLLLLAYFGALLAALGWRASAWVCLDAHTERSRPGLTADAHYFTQGPMRPNPPPPWMNRELPIRISQPRAIAPGVSWPDDPLTAVPYRLLRPLERLCAVPLPWRARGFYLLGGAWTLVVGVTFGLMITRMAVLQWGRDERLPVAAAVGFGLRQAGAHLWAWTLPLLAVAALGLPIYLVGWLMRWDAGLLLAGVTWLLLLPVWFLAMVILVGWFLAWPLMWGALAADSHDAFDAISRSYSYALQRPARYLAYLLLSFGSGLLAWLLLWCAAEWGLRGAWWIVEWGAGPSRTDVVRGIASPQAAVTGLPLWGPLLLRWGAAAVRGCVSAYAYAYFWTALAGIYLLLRYDIDDTEMDEILGTEPTQTGREWLPPA